MCIILGLICLVLDWYVWFWIGMASYKVCCILCGLVGLIGVICIVLVLVWHRIGIGVASCGDWCIGVGVASYRDWCGIV